MIAEGVRFRLLPPSKALQSLHFTSPRSAESLRVPPLNFFLLKRGKTQRCETYQLSLINTSKQGLNAVFRLTRYPAQNWSRPYAIDVSAKSCIVSWRHKTSQRQSRFQPAAVTRQPIIARHQPPPCGQQSRGRGLSMMRSCGRRWLGRTAAGVCP